VLAIDAPKEGASAAVLPSGEDDSLASASMSTVGWAVLLALVCAAIGCCSYRCAKSKSRRGGRGGGGGGGGSASCLMGLFGGLASLVGQLVGVRSGKGGSPSRFSSMHGRQSGVQMSGMGGGAGHPNGAPQGGGGRKGSVDDVAAHARLAEWQQHSRELYLTPMEKSRVDVFHDVNPFARTPENTPRRLDPKSAAAGGENRGSTTGRKGSGSRRPRRNHGGRHARNKIVARSRSPSPG
jgi:hypothetical protein